MQKLAIPVAVLGASPNPDRYSHKAVLKLAAAGYTVLPVNPAQAEIAGHPSYPSLEALPRPVDTLTLYVNPTISSEMAEKIRELAPRRVIFNPGTENPALRDSLASAGITVQEACTLVLLATQQF